MTSNPATFTSYPALSDYLRCLPDRRVILVDGFAQSGTSKTGRLLAEELDRHYIDLDIFLECRAGHYVDRLDLAILRLTIQRTAGLVLLGLCVREAAEALNIEQPFHVYVKRMVTAKRLWADKAQASPSAWISPDNQSQSDIESRDYHLRVSPQLIADCVFEKCMSYQ